LPDGSVMYTPILSSKIALTVHPTKPWNTLTGSYVNDSAKTTLVGFCFSRRTIPIQRRIVLAFVSSFDTW